MRVKMKNQAITEENDNYIHEETLYNPEFFNKLIERGKKLHNPQKRNKEIKLRRT
jgi:hypothetical protein